jgi:hypothetical protein
MRLEMRESFADENAEQQSSPSRNASRAILSRLLRAGSLRLTAATR